MTKSFAEQLNAARLMAAGMKEKAQELKAIGLTEDDVTKLNTLYNDTASLDEKQERLKGELKTCSAELGEKTKELNALVSAMRKRVKLVIPQTEWKAFGIGDSK